MDIGQRTAPVRVWDAPTRLFHWAIVLLIGAAWLTQNRGWMQWHFICGYSVLALLLFRLAWGFAGSDTSRFSHFLRSPLAALHHLSRLHRREPDTEIGHNAAGGWMVLVMLILLAVQALTGLCANDDIMNQGPLADLVGKERSDWLSHIHAFNFTLIEIAVVMHVCAVIAYGVLKRHDLVRPMITGRKSLPEWVAPPSLASPLRALVMFLLAVAVVVVFVSAI